MHNPCTTQGQTVLQRFLPRPYRYLNVLGMMGMLCLSACQKDNNEDEIYPSLITEFADLHTDQNGTGWIFNTDKGKTYVLSNPQKGLKAKAIYRVMCGYVPTTQSAGEHTYADVYTLESVTMLPTVQPCTYKEDPIRAVSIWKAGRYLNLNLAPKTQGGTHEWGYHTDSITASATGHTYHLSLHHRQLDDPPSYSITVYASILLEELGNFSAGDSITLCTLTFNGLRKWEFAY